MRSKHILLVDDESAVRTVLKGSIRKLGPKYQVVTAVDGFDALDAVQQQAFDLIVTDFNMQGMDGLELIEAIRYQQPQARIMLMTAYGYDGLEDEAKALQVEAYLSKPLEIGKFRELVEATLDRAQAAQANIFTLSDAQFSHVHQLLKQLQSEVNARCIFFTDAGGNTIARIGDAGKIPVGEIASLLGGGIASLAEAGRVLDGDVNSTNLIYRESQHEYLYAVNIGQTFLLIIIIDRGTYSSRLGSVWYYAQQGVIDLQQTLAETETVTPHNLFDESTDAAFDAEFDKLFD